MLQHSVGFKYLRTNWIKKWKTTRVFWKSIFKIWGTKGKIEGKNKERMEDTKEVSKFERINENYLFDSMRAI